MFTVVSFPISYRDFFEINNVVLTVILDTEIPAVRAPSPLWLIIELPIRHGLSFAVIRHLHPVHKYDGSRSLEADIHRIPLGPRLPRLGQGFCQGIQRPG